MFYKVLLLLTIINLIKAIRSFVTEALITTNGNIEEITTVKYISFGITFTFYLMVFAICCIPSMLF